MNSKYRDGYWVYIRDQDTDKVIDRRYFNNPTGFKFFDCIVYGVRINLLSWDVTVLFETTEGQLELAKKASPWEYTLNPFK